MLRRWLAGAAWASYPAAPLNPCPGRTVSFFLSLFFAAQVPSIWAIGDVTDRMNLTPGGCRCHATSGVSYLGVFVLCYCIPPRTGTACRNAAAQCRLVARPSGLPACWSGWRCAPCLSCARLQGAAALQQCPLPAIVLRNSAPRRACSAAVAFMERRALVAAATGLPMCGCNLAPGCDLAPAHSSPALQWRSWSECSGGCTYRSCKLGV